MSSDSEMNSFISLAFLANNCREQLLTATAGPDGDLQGSRYKASGCHAENLGAELSASEVFSNGCLDSSH